MEGRAPCRAGAGVRFSGSVRTGHESSRVSRREMPHLCLQPLLLVFRGSLPYSGATAPLQPTGNLRHRVHLGLKHTCAGQPYDLRVGQPYGLPVLVVWLDMNKAEKLGFCLLEASGMTKERWSTRNGWATQAKSRTDHESTGHGPSRAFTQQIADLGRNFSKKMTRDGSGYCFPPPQIV